MNPPKTIQVGVSDERFTELAAALKFVEPTTANPYPGERVLVLGLQAIKRQHERRKYQREWRRRKGGTRLG